MVLSEWLLNLTTIYSHNFFHSTSYFILVDPTTKMKAILLIFDLEYNRSTLR